MRVLDATQMREADRRTIEEIGVPSLVLMENAGRQVVAALDAAFDDLSSMRVSILCGRGNNGGDGFVVARILIQRGMPVLVAIAGDSAQIKGDARVNLEALRDLGASVTEIMDADAWRQQSAGVLDADLIVDALTGTGATLPLSDFYKAIVDDVNAGSNPVVSIDLPSGLGADSPETAGAVVDAAMTVTLAAPKLSLVIPPGEHLAGSLVIADIGIPAAVIDGVSGSRIELLTRSSVRALIEPRAPDSHKGDYGHVLVVAGSPGKTGAAALAAMGALRSGAGLVTVATPAGCQPVVAALGAEFMTLALAEDASGLVDPAAADQVLGFGADVIAVGPGLGRSAGARAFVRALVARSAVTLVLDADAVVAFAGDSGALSGRDGTDVIITPHPGEMAQLTGRPVVDIQKERIACALDFATSHRVHVILKGYRTIVATPDGRAFINTTGNPGMATAGSGDVLTGAVAAWAAQLGRTEAACKLGVYLHGLAGDFAAAEKSEPGMIAGDIAAQLGDAALTLTSPRPQRTT